MKKKNKQMIKYSKCCNARVKIVKKTTMHYVCLLCKKACDIYRRKRLDILTPKDIKQIRKEEDF